MNPFLEPIRFLWALALVSIAAMLYGPVAAYIAVAGHVALPVGMFLVTQVFGRTVTTVTHAEVIRKRVATKFTALLGFVGVIFLMYSTVHLLGWGCFFLLFLSFVHLEVKHT